MFYIVSFQRIPRILLFIVLFSVSCAQDQVGQVEQTVQSSDEYLVEAACERPYAETSVWNVPIDWSRARIHPDNDAMVDTFFDNYRWIGANTLQYAPNIYFVSNSMPMVLVKLREYRFRDAFDDISIQYGDPGGTVWIPLPAEARPAPGSDGQLAVINIDTGEEWGINEGIVDRQGNWSAGGVYRYHITNSGIPPEGFGQRGAGIGQFGGIVRPCEIERGYIGHAVTIAYDYPCAPDVCKANGWPAVVFPFKKTDGKGTSQYDIPEGARLVIRPEISRNDILSACAEVKGCFVWALNMQEYGGFIVDNSGNPKTYAEGNASADWDPDIWFADMLSGIPSEWYAVVDWNYPSTKAR